MNQILRSRCLGRIISISIIIVFIDVITFYSIVLVTAVCGIVNLSWFIGHHKAQSGLGS